MLSHATQFHISFDLLHPENEMDSVGKSFDVQVHAQLEKTSEDNPMYKVNKVLERCIDLHKA